MSAYEKVGHHTNQCPFCGPIERSEYAAHMESHGISAEVSDR